MASRGDGIAVIDKNEVASHGSDITRRQHHRSWKLTLHVEVKIINKWRRVATIKLVELEWAVIAPVDRRAGSGISERERIARASSSGDVGVWAGKPRDEAGVRGSAGGETEGRSAKVLQLA